MIEQELARRYRDLKTLRAMGHENYGHLYTLGSVSPEQERIIHELPINTEFNTPLRKPDGTRIYPAGYLNAGDTNPQ